MLIYFALESQTQKPLRSIILHKIIFVNVLHIDLSCWSMDESNMVFHQYGFQREIIYFQYNIEMYLSHP